MFNLDDLRNNPLNFAQTVDIGLLEEALVYLNEKYEKGNAIVSDEIYDLLKDNLIERNRDSNVLKNVGCSINSSNKEKLQFYLGSMDKVKPNTKQLHKFIKDNVNYVLSDKLDGISLLVIINNGKYQCYTRGDGHHGQNITHLLNNTILFKDGKIPLNNMSIRGELIIEKKYKDKFKSNIRNIVSGYSGRKEVDKSTQKYIVFVAYELLNNVNMIMSEQFSELSNYFRTSFNICHTNFDNTYLEEYLKDRKQNSDYDIDGIIICKDIKYKAINSGNPKHAVAFKMIMNEQIKQTTIKYVEWNISKDGYLIPTVVFEPINICGCKYERANGVNAENIVKNSLGKGAIVLIIRCGDVIPNVYEVLEPGEVVMPKYKYKWNTTRKHIVLDEENDETSIKQIIYFFKILKIKGISDKIINKMVSCGHNTLDKILTIKRNDLLKLDGIQDKMADNIIENISHGIENSHISKIMTASNCFGRSIAEKKIVIVIDNIKDLFDKTYQNKELYDKLIRLHDFGDLSSKQFVDGLHLFKDFIKKHPYIMLNFNNNEIIEGDLFKNQNISFTGIRNVDLEYYIKKNSGAIIDNINKECTLLICKDRNNKSNKIKLAKSLHIDILEINEFIEKYNINN